MTWSRSSRVSRDADVLEASVDGHLVVLHPGNGEYAGLDGTARRTWELLADPTTFGELVDLLAAEFGVPRSVCAPDLAGFLEGARRQGLVRRDP